jgi:hypothetical protein
MGTQKKGLHRRGGSSCFTFPPIPRCIVLGHWICGIPGISQTHSCDVLSHGLHRAPACMTWTT